MSTIVNAAGSEVDFAAAVELMDEFGEEFAPSMERGQW